LFWAQFREGTLIKKPIVLLAEAGLELLSDSAGKAAIPATGGAKSGALSPDLATIIEAWSRLPKHVRQTILDIVRASNH
jgi:hypothetical protein